MSITIKMKADRFNSNRHVVYRMTRNHLPPRLSRNRIEFEFLWDKHRFMEDGGHGKQLWRRKSFSYTYAEVQSSHLCLKHSQTSRNSKFSKSTSKELGQTGKHNISICESTVQKIQSAFIVFRHCIPPKKTKKCRVFFKELHRAPVVLHIGIGSSWHRVTGPFPPLRNPWPWRTLGHWRPRVHPQTMTWVASFFFFVGTP